MTSHADTGAKQTTERVRGSGYGLLVGMAVAQFFAAKSGTEKFIGIWMCISTYVVGRCRLTLSNSR